MSQEWTALVRQLCTPSQQRAVSTIALALASIEQAGNPAESNTTAEVARLARRFGLSSGEADLWAQGSVATAVLGWPVEALDLMSPVGLFEEIGLDDTVAVVDRLARAMV